MSDDHQPVSSTAARALSASLDPALNIQGLSKTFGHSLALDQVDLRVWPGEVLGLLGVNGSGKSTLIKILSGYHKPDGGGEVTVAGVQLDFGSVRSAYRAGCRFVHQDLALVDGLSILDNLSLNTGYPSRWGTIKGAEARLHARAALDQLGLDLDLRMSVGRLPAGLRAGVAIARALDRKAGEVSLLVLDEPTATLPETEVGQLLDAVKVAAASGVGVLYVTHRLDEIFEITTTVTVLRDGRVVSTEPTARVDRRSVVTMMIGSDVGERSRVRPVRSPQESKCLTVDAISGPELHEVSFGVSAGEIVGIAGITGSGRDVLLGSIFGGRTRNGGRVMIGDADVPQQQPRQAMALGLAFVPAERARRACLMTLSAAENLTIANIKPFWRWPALRKRTERAEVAEWSRRLRVAPADAMERPMSTFSGGNQQKIILARWLRRRPKVLLLDEPTQGVDVGAKAELHEQIRAAAAAGSAVVVSSVDVDELVALSHRVLVLRSGRLVAELTADGLTAAAISHESLTSAEAICA
jgi:ribose transport system ATP-binding protein